MRRRSLKNALFMAALAIAATPSAATTLEETSDSTLPFASGKRLELTNTNGEIEISSWDREEIRIEARKKVRAGGQERAAEGLEALRVVIEESADGVVIDTDYPRRGESRWWSWHNDVSASVDYTISLPTRADLDVGTVNGRVRVTGIEGSIELRSTNGGITVVNAGGSVNARTTNGGIDVELQEVAPGEDMSFRTINGGITLSLPSDIRAALSARTTNGGIRTDFPVTVHGSLSRTRLEGEINGGGGRIELHTTNGGIRIGKS